jgi:hypothetical protein
MNKNEPLTDYTIYYQPVTGAFGFTTGRHPPSSDAQLGPLRAEVPGG